MRISPIGLKQIAKASFKSLRQDKNITSQLINGENALIENNKENIYTSVNNIAAVPNRENIEFLLHIADNLAYGQGRNSEFKDALDSDDITPQNRENTDWVKLLDDSVKRLIDDSGEDVSDLIDDYKRIFGEKKQLSPEQKSILKLRADLTNKIIDNAKTQEDDDIARVTRIRQNIDYFAASSEIPLKQKNICLEKLLFFMSDDYKINPQLENKKLQVLDEILNDIVVKAPDNEILRTKDIDQRQSGICAAVSICRKAMAYEDKPNFIDLVIDELQDSPEMSVYDITELGSGEKVKIKKPDVNYNYALARGYRIIDASAHIWMHNAHAGGDGTLLSEIYVPFDSENYGLFSDTSWMASDDEQNHDERELLRAVIKEREAIESVYKVKKEKDKISTSLESVNKESYLSQCKSLAVLNKIFTDIFPEKTQREITSIIKSLFSFYKGSKSDNEINVPQKLSKELKSDIIKEFIISSVGDISESQKKLLDKNSQRIYEMTDEYIKSEKKTDNLKRFNTPKGRYLYYRKLFNAAAAHRIAIERDMALSDGAVRFEKFAGLPPRDTLVSDYMSKLHAKLALYSFRENFKTENGKVPSKAQLEKELVKDTVKIKTLIPTKINGILKALTGSDLTALAVQMYKKIILLIQEGNTDILSNVKIAMNIDDDKKGVLQKLEKIVEKIENSPNDKDVQEAVRLLGYDDKMQFASNLIASFNQSMAGGISEGEYKRLLKYFGSEKDLSNGILLKLNEFQSAQKEYYSILKKWNVPDSSQIIMKKLESQNDVLSRSDLDNLYHHFNSIQAGVAANEKIANTKQRTKKNNLLYTFSPQQNGIFKKIEKNLSSMRKYSNMEYKNLNNILFDELEETYSTNGMLNGQFWVREEGSTGLASNEQIRIIEQMTGKPYHIEFNVKDAAKQIKQGKGSGIIAMSVLDDDYAFHAQYVPSVTQETFKDSKTGKISLKDVIWTDNSWGNAEKDSFWNGRNGFEYTDYGSGYGWKDGFILSKDRKIGLPVSDIHGAMGYSKEDEEDFGLFTDVILPGNPVNVYQKLYKMFGYIININEGSKNLNALEESIKNGKRLNIDVLDKVDDISSERISKLEKRANNEIKSQEDFDKLSDDDPLKFAFKKLAVYMSTDNPMLADCVVPVDNQQELDDITDTIFEEHVNVINTFLGKTDETVEMLSQVTSGEFNDLFKQIETNFGISLNDNQKQAIISGIFYDSDALQQHNGKLSNLEILLSNQAVKTAAMYFDDEKPLRFFIEKSMSIINKAIDENVRIKSLDSAILTNSPLYSEFTNAIDKYLKPKSDEELLQILKELQEADYETTEKFMQLLQPEDVGVKIKNPYDCLVLYKSGNNQVRKAFSDVVVTGEVYKNLQTLGYEDEESPAGYYRSMLVRLSDMDIQKYIKDYKEEAFRKYKVRQAFPDPVVIPDEQIAQVADEALSQFKSAVDNIENNYFIIDMLNTYEKFRKDYLYNPDFSVLFTQNVILNEENNRKLISPFLNAVYNLYNLTKDDNSLRLLNQNLINIIDSLKKSKGTTEKEFLVHELKSISEIFADFQNSELTKEKLTAINKDETETLKSNIKTYVNSNIDPKYRNEAISQIYKIINMYKNPSPNDDIEYEEAVFENMFVKRHIVKNPTGLLRETVKLMLDGKFESEEYKILKEYLEVALKVAQQTKIQYSLVQNQHEALSSKTKDMLPLFKIYAADGTQEDMDSALGMEYLVEKLKNEGDDYKTLNLFLRQSGLSKKAVSALIENFAINQTDNLIDDKTNEIMGYINELNELYGVIQEFFEEKNTPYSDIQTEMINLNNYIKQKVKNYNEKTIFKNYIEYIDSLQYNGTMENTSNALKESMVYQISMDGLQYNADMINVKMSYFPEIKSMLEERKNLIYSIDVPVDSEAYKQRVDFEKRYQITDEYIESKLDEVIKAIEQSSVMGLVPRE